MCYVYARSPISKTNLNLQEASKSADQTEKAIKDAESKLLAAFKPILEKFFGGNNKLDNQLIGIYAVQAGWYAMGCPKGKNQSEFHDCFINISKYTSAYV
jgi:hypothetical protein